jgi:hypothetical protein
LLQWLTGRSLDSDRVEKETADSFNCNVPLSDDLVNWLWHAAFNRCRQTGDWDLLHACAGIAHAIRTEGLPLSAGLWASAAPTRSGGSDFGSE